MAARRAQGATNDGTASGHPTGDALASPVVPSARHHGHLLDNPFHHLQAGPHVSPAALERRAEELRATLGALAGDALAQLRDPVGRLHAEVSWLPGVRPSRVERIVRAICTFPDALLPLHGLPPLARANAVAAEIQVCLGRLEPAVLEARVTALDEALAAVCTADVLPAIDADREEAGIGRLGNDAALEEALAGRRAFLAGTSRAAHERCARIGRRRSRPMRWWA